MRSERRHALTLFEVTIVIFILGILATVSMPRLSLSVQSAQLRNCVSAIESHLAYARAVAINRGRTVTISFNNTDDLYQSAEIGFPDQPGSTLLVNVHSLFDPSIDLQANFDGGTTLSFDSEGMPVVGSNQLASGVIALSAAGTSYLVTIRPGLGTVSSSLAHAN